MSFWKIVKYKSPVVIITLLFSIISCKSYKEQRDKLPDNKYKGTINVSADESFKPIIDAQVQVYEANFPGTKIRVQYKPEAECIKDLGVDSTRMIIVTRKYNEDEKEFVVDSMHLDPESMTVAKDAVTVIMNPSAPYSGFTMKEVREILEGRFSKKLIPVFDGVKATSTVRFIIDSVLRGDTLTAEAVAARSSEGVIDYVSKNPDVVGFIGVSWIGNPEDTTQLGYLKKVKIMPIESIRIPGMYAMPTQANIFFYRYPMVRDLVYILKENYNGLGHGFADFMSGETGQLIFRRAYLVPAQKNFGIRPVKLNE